jgi:phytoene dehydrogenase-like protein
MSIFFRKPPHKDIDLRGLFAAGKSGHNGAFMLKQTGD